MKDVLVNVKTVQFDEQGESDTIELTAEGKFAEKNGSIICSDLLGLNEKPLYNPNPDKRTDAYFKKRPCIKCVTDCVELIEEKLM